MHPRTRELLDYLDQQRVVLRAAFDAVPPMARDRVPGPQRWSAANVIEHVAIVEARLAGRFSGRIAEARAEGIGPEVSTTPVLPTVNIAQFADRATRVVAPDATHPKGIVAHAAWRVLGESTAALRAAVIEGDGLALGKVSMPHPLLGSLSLYEFIAFVGAHEARHAAQLHVVAADLRGQA